MIEVGCGLADRAQSVREVCEEGDGEEVRVDACVMVCEEETGLDLPHTTQREGHSAACE